MTIIRWTMEHKTALSLKVVKEVQMKIAWTMERAATPTSIRCRWTELLKSAHRNNKCNVTDNNAEITPTGMSTPQQQHCFNRHLQFC